MKKHYLMFAAAATMLAACAETDVINDVNEKDSASQAIGFETFADNITREVATADATKLDSYHQSFGVWAYKTPTGGTKTSVMNNYQVAYSDNDWKYDNVTGQVLKYWDKNAKYSFYAYAPYYAVSVTENNGVISIAEGQYAANENLQTWSTTLNSSKFTGTGSESASESTDWMIADVITDYETYTQPVSENFKHIMSKLVVKLKSTVAYTVINSVSINNVHGKGSYNGTEWSTGSNDVSSISGAIGTIATINTDYYTMEYLLIPSSVAPTFSVNYSINGDTYRVENKDITGISSFSANTKYELTVTIDLDAIEFTTSASDFNSGSGTVLIE